MKRAAAVFVLVAALVFAMVGTASAAYEFYMQIQGIPGESTDEKHKNWIEVLSISQPSAQQLPMVAGQATMPTPPRPTGTAGAGQVTITKALDKSSPGLFQCCAGGKQMVSVRIEQLRDRMPFMAYDLKNVLITRYVLSRPTGRPPMEEVSFNYARVEWTYTVSPTPTTAPTVGGAGTPK